MPDYYSRDDFLAEYEFPEEPERDFQINGQDAEWASGHPKIWGQEKEWIELPGVAADGTNRSYTEISSAISGDVKLLAVSVDDGPILIYDIGTKELRQKLDGTGKMVFGPLLPLRSDNDTEKEAEEASGPAYTVVSSIPNIGRGNNVNEASKLIVWELDKHGRLLDDEVPVDESALATKAIESITAQLEKDHEWSKKFINSSTLHADFEKALKSVAADHRRRHNTIIDNATMPGYGKSTISSDGKLIIYIENDAEREQPKAVIWDIGAGKEVARLTGHTDNILFAGFSPDNKNVATVSFDGTMRMHSVTTGLLLWATENSGGQSWTGDFTPDGKHIVWSCEAGQTLQVHDVSDGKLVSKFQRRFNKWCRSLTWHPDSQQLAFCAAFDVYIWRPFDGPDGTIAQHSQLSKFDWHGFGDIQEVKWIEHGRKLVLMASDGTVLVWDAQTNSKELFKRSKGTQVAFTLPEFYHVEDNGSNNGDVYLSVDGDRMVRYWRLSVPANSWWDKKEPEKKVFPETGKYVNIVKKSKPKEDKQLKPNESTEETARDVWAEKGAELWTAE